MGCMHSKANKDQEHMRKIKIKEVLESSTQDPNNILKMKEPQHKPAPIVDASGHEDGPDGVIRLTEPSMKPRRHLAKAHTSVTGKSVSSSGSTEEIWAKLHRPQEPQSALDTSPNQVLLQNGVGPAGSVDALHAVQPPRTEAGLPKIINSPLKGRIGQGARPKQWRKSETCSELNTEIKPISNKQAHEAASPSRLYMQNCTSKMELMFGPPEISFRKEAYQRVPPQPMDTEQAFGIQASDSSHKKGSKRVHKAPSHVNDNAKVRDTHPVMHGSSIGEPAQVIPNAGDERVHGGRWHRKSKPDSPIQDSITNRQVSSQSIGSGPSTSNSLSVILDTQQMGSDTADSTPRLMMHSPRLHALEGVTVLGSPVKQPDVSDKSTRDTSYIIH